MSFIKCAISDNNKVLETVMEETQTKPADLIISLEKFRQTVNETFTKIIADNGEMEDYIDEAASSNDESQEVPVSPKKRKK